MRISVRGIYSTGLIRFLLDKGYELTKLSEKQKERFGIDNEEEPDVFIYDTKDKTGVKIVGNNSKKVIEDMKDVFWDSLFTKKSPSTKTISIIPYGYEFANLPESKIEEIKKEVIPNIPENVGVIFKKPSIYLSPNELIDEIITLISKKYENQYYVFFGYNSKLLLDEFRSVVTRTIKKHHIYRRNLSDIVDFSEIIMDRIEEGYLHYGVKELILKKIDQRGKILRYHRKTYGKIIVKKEIVLESGLYDNRLYLKTFRVMKPGGKYDGLNIERKPGDYSITEYLEGSWYFVISYYNKNKELIGRYININSPLEISTDIYYNDLALDVIHVKNKKYIVDFDELEVLYKNGYITKKAYEKVKEISNILLDEI